MKDNMHVLINDNRVYTRYLNHSISLKICDITWQLMGRQLELSINFN